MKAPASSGESRMARIPGGAKCVNIWPLHDVYGFVAPFRSTFGLVARSFSYSASFAAGIGISGCYGYADGLRRDAVGNDDQRCRAGRNSRRNVEVGRHFLVRSDAHEARSV